MNVQLAWKICGGLALSLYLRVRVIGLSNLPSRGGVIVAPNHVSNLDPPLVGSRFLRHHTTLAKRELFRSPFAASIMRQWGALPVDRGHPSKETLAELVERLRGGDVLLLFPEGTRSRDGRLANGQRGIAMIALAASVPVVPVFVAGTRRAMPPGSSFPRPLPVTIAFGKPIWSEDFTNLRDAEGRPLPARRVQLAYTRRVMEAIRDLARALGEDV